MNFREKTYNPKDSKAMRRMGKPMVMLVYEGENHSVRKKENMLDYTLK
jgi:dipeptidyl aminopeptidase/acylaminoacyl peptidase